MRWIVVEIHDVDVDAGVARIDHRLALLSIVFQNLPKIE